jgi:hypothetical protein
MTTYQKKVLENLMDMESMSTLIDNLNSHGIVSNNEVNENKDYFISSSLINNWSNAATDYLRTKGYLGGEIRRSGKYFESYGNYLVLFDENKYDHIDALNYLEKTVNKYIKK